MIELFEVILELQATNRSIAPVLGRSPAEELIQSHIANTESMREHAMRRAAHSTREPAWAFATVSLIWAERYFRAEIDLARKTLDDIDGAAAALSRVHERDELGNPMPRVPGSWRKAGARPYTLAQREHD